jgi:hypothetical protein
MLLIGNRKWSVVKFYQRKGAGYEVDHSGAAMWGVSHNYGTAMGGGGGIVFRRQDHQDHCGVYLGRFL